LIKEKENAKNILLDDDSRIFRKLDISPRNEDESYWSTFDSCECSIVLVDK
jgi:hypothetical protein